MPRIIDSPQQVTFAEFRSEAVLTPLVNHGRKAEVRWRNGDHCFVDALGDEGLRQAHETAVNNALYFCEAQLSGDGPDWYTRKMEPPGQRVLDEYPHLAARFPTAAAYVRSSPSDELIAELEAFGYQVHQGGPDDGRLKEKWWWTLSRPEWSGVESSPLEFATEAAAWRAAAKAYRTEELEAVEAA